MNVQCPESWLAFSELSNCDCGDSTDRYSAPARGVWADECGQEAFAFCVAAVRLEAGDVRLALGVLGEGEWNRTGACCSSRTYATIETLGVHSRIDSDDRPCCHHRRRCPSSNSRAAGTKLAASKRYHSTRANLTRAFATLVDGLHGLHTKSGAGCILRLAGHPLAQRGRAAQILRRASERKGSLCAREPLSAVLSGLRFVAAHSI